MPDPDGCGFDRDPRRMVGQLGRTASAGASRFGGAGVEPGLHRHAHRDEHRELLQSTARGDRSHGDLRRVQRHRTALHPALRSRPGPPRRVAPGGGHRRGPHRPGRPVPVPAGGARRPLRGLAGRAGATTARTAASRASAASNGEPRWPQAVLAWRATDGFSASYPPFTGGTAVGQWRPTPPAFAAMSAQALAFTATFVLASNAQFRPAPPRGLDSATVRGRLQRGQGARSQDRIDAHGGPDGARSVLGGRTPASTGIRPPTRWRAPTTCPCPAATGCSRS